MNFYTQQLPGQPERPLLQKKFMGKQFRTRRIKGSTLRMTKFLRIEGIIARNRTSAPGNKKSRGGGELRIWPTRSLYFLSHWLFLFQETWAFQNPGILDSNYLISAISEWTGIPELTIIERRTPCLWKGSKMSEESELTFGRHLSGNPVMGKFSIEVPMPMPQLPGRGVKNYQGFTGIRNEKSRNSHRWHNPAITEESLSEQVTRR